MSDYYLPLEIQDEIMKRLPVKSLVEFRFVSKTWKCLIESPDFIAAYSRQQHSQQVQYLLVNYGDLDLGYETYLDEHTFPQQKVYLTLPPLVERLTDCRTISSSQGLLCLYGCYHEGTTKEVVVLWNISIRKAITVVLRNLTEGIYGIVLGFGVCRETTEPKIVKITHVDHKRTTTYQVEVFALRTRAWRSPYGNNLPRKSINFYSYIYGEVLINGVFYWLATDRNTMDDEYTLIVSFDMTSEEFGEITLPDSIAHPSDNALSLSNFKE